MRDHVYDGLPISEGIAFGPVRLVRWRVPKVPHRMVSERGVEAEVERFREALVWADIRLHEVRDSTEERLGHMEARIFEPQLLMLEDGDLIDGTLRYI